VYLHFEEQFIEDKNALFHFKKMKRNNKEKSLAGLATGILKQ